MINERKKLQLQAYLDHELSPRQARRTAAWLEQDDEARALYADLSALRIALAGNELEAKLADSRAFYWSKIERGIRQNPTEQRAPFLAGYPWWMRSLAPAVGATLLLIACLSVGRLTTPATSMSYLHEIETPLDDTTAISFHSQTAGMTVVWVQSQGY
jgi:anti-sigma factor RsiW